MKREDEIYQSIIDRYRSLPADLDQNTVKSWIESVNKQMERVRQRNQQRQQSRDLNELLFSRRLGVVGFVLVATGSMMQSFAAML
ncbi:hypothetical protein Oter_1082 [Opitutus terrae PB90-1]|uniref:Uncharacterized protein n=2 Tax=Opitutus terrae TaxID=107709 RepID=B1ZMM5_OPITP|nr:hypothetical protein Oter_1082 [Opitutus terrae PB90-1]